MLRTALVSLVLLAAASPTLAQSAWSIEGTAGVVSDYRFRGSSLSNRDPALQAGLTLRHASGVYGDVFVSSIDEYGIGVDGDGADVEFTGSLGWAGVLAGLDVDAALSAYQYPDGDDVNYVEAPVQIGKSVKDVTWTLGFAYAPAQTALADDDNRYGWAGLAYAPESWPISLTGTIGYEQGAFAPDGKTDWVVGVAREFGPTTVEFSWVDSDVDAGALVASVFVNF